MARLQYEQILETTLEERSTSISFLMFHDQPFNGRQVVCVEERTTDKTEEGNNSHQQHFTEKVELQFYL